MSRSDQTTTALRALAGALRRSLEDLDQLARRSDNLATRLDGGEPLEDALAAEDRPLIVARLTTLIDRLQDAATAVRRAEASQLHEEGCSHERIAQAFGVSRQRAAALLKPTSGRRPFRPAGDRGN